MMDDVATLVRRYLDYCEHQKNLSPDTLKAYRIDLTQFAAFLRETGGGVDRGTIAAYVTRLHGQFQPRSTKRKFASLRAFCVWMEYESLVDESPVARLKIRFNEPMNLPRTIPLTVVEALLGAAYREQAGGGAAELRDVAVLELLFATGMRVSELCHLRPEGCDWERGTVLILGKGAKERVLQIGNGEVLAALGRYRDAFREKIAACGWLFVNRLGERYSEQSVRAMIRKYMARIGVGQRVTPHMFRHTFATQLLEEDVDIRYIQALLGHSSISTTQIYTHVTTKKTMAILMEKHPRNKMQVGGG